MGDLNNTQGIASAPKRFFFETLTGIAIFGIIALAAVGLSFFVKFLDVNGIDPVIVVCLKGAEYAIFFMDIILFGRFLWRTGLKTWGEL